MLSMINEFKKFLFRGNVIDLLVGIVIGGSFGALINAFVTDFVTPFIGVLIKVPDFSKMSFVVNGSIFNYGHFINTAISFILVASVIFFFIVKPVNVITARLARKAEREKEEAEKAKC